MALTEIEIAWVRFVALRDQLIAARDEENGVRPEFELPPLPGPSPSVIELPDVASKRKRPRVNQGRRRTD
jgi:hypothetical protein